MTDLNDDQKQDEGKIEENEADFSEEEVEEQEKEVQEVQAEEEVQEESKISLDKARIQKEDKEDTVGIPRVDQVVLEDTSMTEEALKETEPPSPEFEKSVKNSNKLKIQPTDSKILAEENVPPSYRGTEDSEFEMPVEKKRWGELFSVIIALLILVGLIVLIYLLWAMLY